MEGLGSQRRQVVAVSFGVFGSSGEVEVAGEAWRQNEDI